MDKDARTSWFTFWTFVFFCAYCWALAQAWLTTDVRWMSICFGSVAAVVMLLDRKNKHDELMEPSVGIYVTGSEQQPQPTEVEYRPQIQSENGKKLKMGKFSLTRAQWANVGREIERADGRVIRDVIARARAFESLSRKWPHIVAEFERLGWAKDGMLTDAGKEWFSQFTTPPPHA